MNKEERKAIAMQETLIERDCESRYPECCRFHEGYDAALSLFKPNERIPRHYVLQVELEDDTPPIILSHVTEADRAFVNAVASYVCNCARCNAKRSFRECQECGSQWYEPNQAETHKAFCSLR